MATNNTSIEIKYSSANVAPVSLNTSEPAYSFASDKLYIGNTAGTPLVIGGKLYVDDIERATQANTFGQLVRRDGSGGFQASYIEAELYGNARTANAWQNTITFFATGDTLGNVALNGSSNVTINTSLPTTGVTSGTYGGQTQIPIVTVDTKGRLTNVSTVNVATRLLVSGDVGSGTLDLLTDGLVVKGNDGITTAFVDANNPSAAAELVFTTSSFVINPNTGNVGIGISTPLSKLHIAGDARITGITTVTNAVSSISTTTGAVQVVGGIGVGDSVYVKNRVGFVSTSNVSTVYQVYNITANSLDTVFG
jgi:hypothetical protein